MTSAGQLWRTPGSRAVPLGLGLERRTQHGVASRPRATARLVKLALPSPWALLGLSLRDERAIFFDGVNW